MLKIRIYKLVDKGEHGQRVNLFIDYAIMSLIVLNLVAIILESIQELTVPFMEFLRYFEIFSVIIFSVEYMMRLYASEFTHPSGSKIKSALIFVFSFYGLIDLLAIVPFYLPFLIAVDLRFLRVLRLIRFLRILKINRYNNSLTLIWTVIREKKAELFITVFVMFLFILVASFLMYYIEGDAQPDKFSNIPNSFWWAVATLTTVGYGDVYPVTAIGKFISGLIAVLGIGLVALPTGLISAGFINKISEKVKTPSKCPHCGKELH